jgi:hypothetical protein
MGHTIIPTWKDSVTITRTYISCSSQKIRDAWFGIQPGSEIPNQHMNIGWFQDGVWLMNSSPRSLASPCTITPSWKDQQGPQHHHHALWQVSLLFTTNGCQTVSRCFSRSHGMRLLNDSRRRRMHFIRSKAGGVGTPYILYSIKDISLHSVMLSVAIAMYYLANVPFISFMLLGHWSSDALDFLLYILPQSAAVQ